ncbi:MAG: hypothetical protein KAT04_11125 [Methylococcales bacterium]|nr:hypothetical protein [Methylococcales bacterium]
MEQIVHVDTHYTRSINLERDIDSSKILNAYIPTSKAIQVLEKITQTFTQKNTPRAWSLVGPYGSGKSSFAIFLAHLLEDQSLETSLIAERLITQHQPELARKITAHAGESNAYCTVLLTGSSESLSQRFLQVVYLTAQEYWLEKQGRKPKIIDELADAVSLGATVSEIINLLDKLQKSIHQVQGKGLLIVIDELGKFLEYEARHQGANDIFLLQALAEFAYKGKEANVLLVVLMHQAFDQYAQGMGEAQRNEWTKVQGRFESIPFLESAEQTLRVVAAAFKPAFNKQQKSLISGQVSEITTALIQQQALPSAMTQSLAKDIFTRCYPLHPVAAILLPVLCQKIAQNERTLFSYLGSQEHYGFHDGLKRLDKVGNWVLVWEVFEYFILNQSIMTSDHTTHRRWIEVLNAIERLGDAPESEIQLLKTIGLLNIIGKQGGLKASQAILAECFPDKQQVESDLAQLKAKSIINYRKFSNEFRIWEGSDFDLQACLRQTIQELGQFDLAETLNNRKTLLPIVARRYSIKNATLRYFQPFYTSVNTLNTQEKSDIQPHIAFFLADTEDEIERFQTQATAKNISNLTVFVLCENATKIRDAVTEVMALEKIQTENPVIKSDPVAQRELKDRLMTAQYIEGKMLNQMLEQPEKNQWVWNAEKLDVQNKKALQQQLSSVLEKVYSKSPIIKNELINRNKTSSQANSAKNKLVTGLLSKVSEYDLGFAKDKYPPEKSIYRALFKETGIHVKQDGYWQLIAPAQGNPYQLFHLWDGIDAFLKHKMVAVPLSELYNLLEKPPYGVKQGALSLIFIAYYLSKQRHLALYESDVFCSHITQEHFEILLKRPELFKIEAFSFSGIQTEVFNQYLEKLVGKSPENSTLLDIVKPLAKFIHKLPQYTITTKNIDKQAIAVRDAFQTTQSPMTLLFSSLPIACGFTAYQNETEFNLSNPSDFLTVLVNKLNILNKAYDVLLDNFQQQMIEAFGLTAEVKNLSELRKELTSRYAGLEKYTSDGIGLKAFIIRLQNNKETDTAWLESVAAFLGKAPADKWKQNNTSQAEYLLAGLSERLKQLVKVHTEQLNADVGSKATLIRIVSEQVEMNQVAYITDELKQAANKKLAQLDLGSADKQLKLTILAQLMQELADAEEA